VFLAEDVHCGHDPQTPHTCDLDGKPWMSNADEHTTRSYIGIKSLERMKAVHHGALVSRYFLQISANFSFIFCVGLDACRVCLCLLCHTVTGHVRISLHTTYNNIWLLRLHPIN
jgi:hypothetical protein